MSRYSIPRDHKDRFEEFVKSLFPEGFGVCPDYLRHKMTLISPKNLRDAGIPVYKATQEAGQFMVTFPW